MRAPFLAACALLLCNLFTSPVWAEFARAQSIQPPAWLTGSDGFRRALVPGRELVPGDRLEVGAGGRVVLTWLDGSRLQLAAEAQLSFPARAALAPAWRLHSGVARWAGSAERPAQLGGLPLLLRGGADVLLAALAARDELCVLNGAVEFSGPDPQSWDRTQTVWVRAHDDGLISQEPVSEARLQRWQAPFESQPGYGGVTVAGQWAVVLAAFPDPRQAARFSNRFLQAGLPVSQMLIQVQDKPWYRVLLGGFADRFSAQIYLERMQQAEDLPGMWVFKRP